MRNRMLSLSVPWAKAGVGPSTARTSDTNRPDGVFMAVVPLTWHLARVVVPPAMRRSLFFQGLSLPSTMSRAGLASEHDVIDRVSILISQAAWHGVDESLSRF